jgi:hypothetical protein
LTTAFIVTLSMAGFLTVYAYTVMICSHLHSLLPPWDGDVMKAFPRFQKSYRLFIYFLGYAGASYRSTTYASISTDSGSKLSAAATQIPPQPGDAGDTKS